MNTAINAASMEDFCLLPHATIPEVNTSIPNNTDLIIAALGSLGMIADAGKTHAVVSLSHARLAEAMAGHKEMVYPFLAIQLDDKFGLDELITAFDRKQARATAIYKPWDLYTVSELNRREFVGDSGQEPPISPVEVRGMLLGGKYDEPSLHLRNKAVSGESGQKAAFKEMQHRYRPDSVNLLLQNLADIVIVDAMRREEGQPFLDQATWRRVPQLGFKLVGDKSYAGAVRLPYDYELDLSWSFDYEYDIIGAGLSVGPK